MLNFPTNTEYGKKIPKESFYSRLNLNPVLKRSFVDDVEQIYWKNILSSSSLNVSKGLKVIEINVFLISLKRKECNYTIFDTIEKSITKHLLFIIRYNDEFQLLINYKEECENQKGKFKIIETYKTNWQKEEEISLIINGLNLDQVYENLVFQVAGEKVKRVEGECIRKSVEARQQIDRIIKKVSELEYKKRNEKQFNIQLKLSNEIKKLKLILDEIELNMPKNNNG